MKQDLSLVEAGVGPEQTLTVFLPSDLLTPLVHAKDSLRLNPPPKIFKLPLKSFS